MNAEQIKTNFSKNVRALRLSRKLTQIEFGEKLNYTSKAVSKWENGDVLPDIVTLEMIANFFNIKVDDLISNKNVVRKSHRKRNRIFTTLSSCLLSFFLATMVFIFLYFCKIDGSWKVFTVGAVAAAITFVVFSAIWYKRFVVSIASCILTLCIAFMIMSLLDFKYYWIIIIAAVILCLTFIAFFNIKINVKKDID